MATVAASAPGVVRKPTTYPHDRKFYTGFAIFMALTVLAGFAPTYYLRLFGSAPLHTLSGRPFSWVAYVHGALFTSWVALFIVQTGLIAAHRVKVHMKLGIAGGVLAAGMTAAGLALAIEAGKLGTAPPGLTSVQFFAIPFFDMVVFAAFVATALWKRKNKETHKRLMVLAYISIITAAMARLPGVLPHGPALFYGLTMIPLAIVLIYDFASRRTIHTAYRWGATLLVLSIPARMALSNTAAWKAFAHALIG